MKRFGSVCLMITLAGFFFGNACGVLSAAEVDYGNIINLAGRQRMLTQKMSKEILLIAFNMKEAKNKEDLKKTSALFERTLNGLINGDEELKLEPCATNSIKAQLEKVKTMWDDFKPFVEEALMAPSLSTETVKKVAEKNDPLLMEMNKVVQMYSDECAEVTGNKVGTVINISGRQRMLSQKMAKELLLIVRKVESKKYKGALRMTAALFERSLNGLIKGDAEMGLPPTTDRDILAQMGKVQSIWKRFKPSIIEATLLGSPLIEAIQKDAVRNVMRLNVPLLVEMNKAVQMYEAALK